MAGPYGFGNIVPGFAPVQPRNMGHSPSMSEFAARSRQMEHDLQRQQLDDRNARAAAARKQDEARLQYDIWKTERDAGQREREYDDTLAKELHALEEKYIGTGASDPVLARRIRDLHEKLGHSDVSPGELVGAGLGAAGTPGGQYRADQRPVEPLPPGRTVSTTTHVGVSQPMPAQGTPYAGKYGTVPQGDVRTQEQYDEDNAMLEAEQEQARAQALDRKRNHQKYPALFNPDGSRRDPLTIKDQRENERYYGQLQAFEEDPERDANERAYRERNAQQMGTGGTQEEQPSATEPTEQSGAEPSSYNAQAYTPTNEAIAQLRASPSGVPVGGGGPGIVGLPQSPTMRPNDLPGMRFYDRGGRVVSELPSTSEAMMDARSGHERFIAKGLLDRPDPLQREAFKIVMAMAQNKGWPLWYNQEELQRQELEVYQMLRQEKAARERADIMSSGRERSFRLREGAAGAREENADFEFGVRRGKEIEQRFDMAGIAEAKRALDSTDDLAKQSNPAAWAHAMYEIAHVLDPKSKVTDRDIINSTGGPERYLGMVSAFFGFQFDEGSQFSPQKRAEIIASMKRKKGDLHRKARKAYDAFKSAYKQRRGLNTEAKREGFVSVPESYFGDYDFYSPDDFSVGPEATDRYGASGGNRTRSIEVTEKVTGSAAQNIIDGGE